MLKSTLSRRKFLAGSAALGGAGLLAACGGSAEIRETAQPGGAVEGEPKRGGTIRVPAPSALIGIEAQSTEGEFVRDFLYSSTVQMTDWQGTVGDIALSWEVPDELNWTFKLRNDARFPEAAPTNGRTLVASDIVYSVKRSQSLPQPGATTWNLYVDSCKAVDDTTFTVITKKPYAYLLWLLSVIPIVPKEAVEQWGDLRTKAAGTGPFALSKLDFNAGLNLVRNPLYYQDYPYVNGYDFVILADEAAMQAAFRAGNVDVYPAADKLKADAVRGVSGITITRFLDRAYSNMQLNALKFEPFKDERVREAIDLSIDRESLIDKIQFGEAELSGPIPPCFDSALPQEEVKAAYQVDIQKARQLLAAAGQEDLTFELATSNYQTWTEQAAVVKYNLSKAGITTNIGVYDIGTWLDAMLDSQWQSTIFIHLKYGTDEIPLGNIESWAGRDPTAQKSPMREQGILGIIDPAVDDLVYQAEQTIDDAKRIELIQEAQRLVLKRHGPTLLLYQPYSYLCAYNYIKNANPGTYGLGMRKYDYWIDKG